MLHIDSGQLRSRVVIEAQALATDAIGGQVITWGALGPACARVQALNGQKLVAAQALAAEATHEVLMRYRPLFADPIAATKTYRLRMGGRIFHIRAVDNVEGRNAWVILLCSEGVVKV